MQEDGDPIDSQRARQAIYHRRKQRVQIRFRAELASEFDQSAPIVVNRAVEKMVDSVLNPLAHRVEQQCRDHNCQDQSHRASVRLAAMDQGRNSGDQTEIQSHHGRGSQRVNHAALEDQVHIHQPIAEDRVTEGQRQQH